MRLLRTLVLKRTLPFLLAALLCAAPWGLVSFRSVEKGERDFVIQTTQYHAVIKARLPLQIKYGFNVVLIPIVPVAVDFIANPYNEKVFADPLTPHRSANRYRGPPRPLCAA